MLGPDRASAGAHTAKTRARLRDGADTGIGNRADRANGALQRRLIVQELEVPCVAYQHLPSWAAAGLIEEPAI